MKTAADLQAYCELRFPVGEPTTRSLSVTGEPYVEIGLEAVSSCHACKRPFHEDGGSLPGIVREGHSRAWAVGSEEALWAALAAFIAYAEGKQGTLYWRAPPELGNRKNQWNVYMRCLISDKTPLLFGNLNNGHCPVCDATFTARPPKSDHAQESHQQPSLGHGDANPQ